MENILANEIKQLGGNNIKEGKRIVQFSGNRELLYKSNLYLRTAVNILIPIASFSINSEKEIYTKAKEIDWYKYIPVGKSFSITDTIHSKKIRNSHYATLILKDAVVDNIRELKGVRPNVRKDNPDIKINLHVSDSKCTLSLDSSGDALFKRGYKVTEGVQAPINEVLASGILMLAGWSGKLPLYDLMSGSGTFSTEAALIAQNIPPNFNRQSFSFMNWADFDQNLWNKIHTEAKNNIIKSEKPLIFCSDKHFKALQVARQNIDQIQGRNIVRTELADFFNYHPNSDKGIVILNPPYNVRMEKDKITGFYKRIGDALRKNFPCYEAWIISANFEAIKSIGLRPSQRHILYNGQLECKLNKYELYK